MARSASSIKVDDPQFQEVASREKTPLIKALMSFVPKIVVRRFINEPHRPIRAPEVESYLSCVLFADISGKCFYATRYNYFSLVLHCICMLISDFMFIFVSKSKGKDMIPFLDREV